jgi:cytochrome oxidase assembly protein ShyY1
VVCAGFSSLGNWQWQRGELRAAQADAFARGADHPQILGSRSLQQMPRFQRVSVQGHYDVQRQFLLDNRIHEGQAGYEVLTPFDLNDGRIVLVNRGWLPFTGFRERLPDVSLDAASQSEIIGRVDELPVAGLSSGRAEPAANSSWPKLTSFPDVAELSRSLGRKIEPRILLLDPDAPNGYVRSWQPPGLSPVRHWSYAVQWWAFAALAVILWVVLNLRKIV